MDFNSYLSPESREIIQLVSQQGYAIRQNSSACGNKEFFGLVKGKDFIICLDNIKNKISPVRHYVNETVTHEAVHVAQSCKGGKLGIQVTLDQYKMQDVKNSAKTSGSFADKEEEAYYLEDKPEQALAFLRKYCL